MVSGVRPGVDAGVARSDERPRDPRRARFAEEVRLQSKRLGDIDVHTIGAEVRDANFWTGRGPQVAMRHRAQPQPPTPRRIASPGRERALQRREALARARQHVGRRNLQGPRHG